MADEVPKIKEVIWIGSSRSDVRAFPEDVKDEVGAALSKVQWGRTHPTVSILHGFGSASVREIKVSDRAGTFRVVFTVEFAEAIYVIHAFQKKSKSGRRTPNEQMERIYERLAMAKELHEARD